jgi:hypothetical protein
MPILGGFGNASEYAYRPFIVELPDPFDWVDLTEVEPGNEYISGYAKITGIKSPLPIRVSIGCSYSLVSNVFDNNQTVRFDNSFVNEASFDEYSEPNTRFRPSIGRGTVNAFVKNNQSINLSLIPERLVKEDFNKTYTVNVSVGKSTQDWIVRTRPIDDIPDTFTFTSIGSTTTTTTTQSNEIIVSGLESGFSFDYSVTLGIGSVIVNGINRGSSYPVFNGDSIKLETTSSSLFNTTTFNQYQIGAYGADWSVTTEQENLNILFTPVDFTDQSNLQLSTTTDSDQITVSGLSLNSDLPVTLSNSSASYQVERNSSIIKNFTDTPIEVVNNDKIRLRLTSSGSYSSAVSTNLTVGNTIADWSITTRSAPPPPPPPPPQPPPPPSTTYFIRPIYRYYNRSTGRHVCSQNPSHPTLTGQGFFAEGVLCYAFYTNPAPPGTFGVGFGYNGLSFPCGRAFFPGDSRGGNIYSLINNSIGDELWSPSPSEGTPSYSLNRVIGSFPFNNLTV